MSSKDKDFVDNFFEYCDSYKKEGIRFFAVILCFILLFVLGTLSAPWIIKICTKALPFAVPFIQMSPLEVVFNYLKIGFFFSTLLTLPVFIYQFGKLKIDINNVEERADLLLAAIILMLIILVSGFITYKLLFPFTVMILYGFNFEVAQFASSLSAMVSTFLVILILTIMIALLPFLKKLIKKSRFFNYADLIKYQKPVMFYIAILVGLIALPIEIIALALLFLIFVLWYKKLIDFAKKRD